MLVNLPVDLIRTFVAVAKSRSFTKAAGVVNRTQSAVSMQIKRLEDDLGYALFERSSREVWLTDQGHAFLPYALRLIALHDEALAAVSRPECTGQVRLGAPDDYAHYLPQILSRFAQSHPRVQVYVHCQCTVQLLQDLEKGDIDLAVCTRPGIDPLGVMLRREPLYWVTSGSHLAHETEPLPLALFHRGCFYQEWAEKALEAVGKTYRVAYVSPSVAGIQAAVGAGLAVAPLGASALFPGCRILTEEEGFPALPSAMIHLYRSQTKASSAVDAFAEHVVEGFRRLSEVAEAPTSRSPRDRPAPLSKPTTATA